MRRKDRMSFKERQRRRNHSLFHRGKAVCVNSSGEPVIILESDLAKAGEIKDELVNESVYGLKIGDFL